MSRTFLARATLFVSLVFATLDATAGWELPRGNLQKRALADNSQKTIFTPANSTGLFILVNVNGEDVPVQVDFASGDLFVAGPLDGADELAATSTEVATKFDFLSTPVSSNLPIKLGVPVSIGGQSISQNIILDTAVNSGLAQAFPESPVAGVLGFRNTASSAVANGLKQGNSPMNQIYSQLPNAPFSTFLFAGFDESQASTVEFTGLFTVGSVVDLSQFFQTPSTDSANLSLINQQPAILLGSDNTFSISQLTVSDVAFSLDGTAGTITTTDLFSSAPSNLVQALFSNIEGSSYNQGTGVYTVPCNAEVNATITISSAAPPIPLDPATLVIRSPWNSSECVGSFKTSSSAAITLGTSFLPNVYLLTGFSDSSLSQPILKLLPLTNPADAHAYFASTRTSATFPGSSSSSQGSSQKSTVDLLGDVSDSNSSNTDSLNLPSGSIADQLRHCLPAIIVGAIVLGLVAIGGLIFALVRRRRSGSRQPSAYRNIYHNDNMESRKDLYGHDEESTAKYSDPYHDGN
ncbi:hypothetical protein BC835DRAFT_185414 [Cytidiella melzeri]|nr:hypothetical protein BC835DRAFT_185414 [Cytidiella melzeri]